MFINNTAISLIYALFISFSSIGKQIDEYPKIEFQVQISSIGEVHSQHSIQINRFGSTSLIILPLILSANILTILITRFTQTQISY